MRGEFTRSLQLLKWPNPWHDVSMGQLTTTTEGIAISNPQLFLQRRRLTAEVREGGHSGRVVVPMYVVRGRGVVEGGCDRDRGQRVGGMGTGV